MPGDAVSRHTIRDGWKEYDISRIREVSKLLLETHDFGNFLEPTEKKYNSNHRKDQCPRRWNLIKIDVVEIVF